ncbi:MAG: hypothetical protein NC324_10345 [Bacteroides sp.]|nr:hypothetical protein [Bacteroides sp.]
MENINKFWKNVSRKAKDLIPVQVFPAVVDSVDEGTRTCKVKVNDSVYFEDVRLYALVDDSLKGFCLLPAKDSTVLVGRIANSNELYVVSFSVVDKVLGTIGDDVEVSMDKKSLSYKNDKVSLIIEGNKVSLDVDADKDGIVLNGGSNNGLVKIKELTDKINELVDSFNNHTHTVKSVSVPALGLTDSTTAPCAGSATIATINVPAPDSTANELKQGDYEDPKVKH